MHEVSSKARRYERLSDISPAHRELKVGDALSPLRFNVSLEYVIRKVWENHEGVGNELNQVFDYTYTHTHTHHEEHHRYSFTSQGRI